MSDQFIQTLRSVATGVSDFLIHQFETAHLPLVFASMAALMSLCGIALAYFNRRLAHKLGGFLEIVSGLLLIWVALRHVGLLMGAESSLSGIGWTLLGVVLGQALNLGGGHDREPGFNAEQAEASRRARAVSLLAIGIHSLLDGAVYVASVGHDHAEHGSGMLASMGLVLHEAAEGVVALFLALAVVSGPWRAILLASIVASFSTPIGTVLANSIVGILGEGVLEAAYPIAAGFIGAAGASLLWPHALRSAKVLSSVGKR